MVFKIVFAPNSPFDFHGLPEMRWRKKKKRSNYEAFCFSSKRNNINVVFIRHYINFFDFDETTNYKSVSNDFK